MTEATGQGERITVLLVDDHALVRGGVRAYLETQPDLEIAGEAGSGREAVELAAARVPDVVLMDLVMPEMDGIEATLRVWQVSPRSQVVVLTSFHDDAHVFPALKAGALSYLLKDAGPDEVAAAVRAAARGEAVINPRVAARLIQEFRGERGPQVNPYTDLTEREQEVLRLIAQGRSNGEIAAALTISEKTVKATSATCWASSTSRTAPRPRSTPGARASSAASPEDLVARRA